MTVYHTIVRRKTAAVFDALNRHDPEPVLADLAPRVEHVMYGDHALSGTRHDPQTVRAWYARLMTVHPDVRFDLRGIAVRGWPWRTVVYVEWDDSALGGSYVNRGVNVIELAWGKVTAIRIHCDTQAMTIGLARVAANGQADAAAAPLLDRPGTT